MSVVQATFAATLADEWVRAGITDAVVCPGSRGTPLVLALAQRDELRVHVRLDERGAGFFALGIALATGRPVVVSVTSGTAAAELHPAVVEAHHARVPLIVCTADRPPELHGVGAPQTIDQVGLYGPALRWAADPGVADPACASSWRSLAARAVAEASGGPQGPGPVHLNLAFREPLVGLPGPLPPGRPAGSPWHRVAGAPGTPALLPWATGRGVLLAGAGAGPADALVDLAAHLGWPLLADPRSGCRRSDPHVVAAADAIARAAPPLLRPELVVRLGAPWASKALPSFLAGADAVVVDPWWRWQDPGHDALVVHRASPQSFVEAALALAPPDGGSAWLAAWQDAERVAQEAIDAALAGGDLTEPALARSLLAWVPGDATVVVSSSMPVRDLEWFARPLAAPPRVLANRGANGIDGVVSSALGAAAAGAGPVVAVVGDLAFLHDVGALVTLGAGQVPGSCTIVVVDNGGGGIFELLPQASALERGLFDAVLATPPAVDVVEVARGFGVAVADVAELGTLEEAVRAGTAARGVSVVRARVPPRQANAALHGRVDAAVAGALGVAG